MPFDIKTFSNKLMRYRNQFPVSIEEVSSSTGISISRLRDLENGQNEPSGDEILILADFFKCDFNYFISNEKETVLEKTELLFRRYGKELSTNDRWAIQECIFFAESENYLDELYSIKKPQVFQFNPVGSYFKQQGIDAAIELRKVLNYRANEFRLDIYSEFRKAGFLIYRRKLENSSISGVCIAHPQIGKIILVNYDEDIYRQRFTVAHEVGHAIFDSEDGDIELSFIGKWDKDFLKEVRANNFAASFLIPYELIFSIPNNKKWDGEKIIEWANKVKVNTKSLLIALKNNGLITDSQEEELSIYKIPSDIKMDPEYSDFSQEMLERLTILLERGLTYKYINKCFKAQRDNKISMERMFEMMFIEHNQFCDINNLLNPGKPPPLAVVMS
jgi:Zn-dependent peptidase ImmA (M78 family)